MAEYFRDKQHQDVLLFIDNIFRFTQAGSEVSALIGRIPSAVGYQPTLSTEMGALQERITSTKNGSITSIQAVYVPADDLTDPAPATTFAHLDATTVLSRQISSLGIYPAVDPLESTSRILTPEVVGKEHYETARAVQRIIQKIYRIAGYYCDYGYGRTFGRGQEYRKQSEKGSEIFVTAVLCCGTVYRYAKVNTFRLKKQFAALRKLSRVNVMIFPNRVSFRGRY